MPLFKWEDIEEGFITPSHTTSKGRSIMGHRLGIQRILHTPGGGAKTHLHAEQQLFISLKGKMKIRAGNEWSTMDDGDLFLMHPYIEMEEVTDGEFLWLNIKDRIPGYSWYDHSWVPGSKEDWKKVEAILNDMDQKNKESVSFLTYKYSGLYKWDEFEDTLIAPNRSPSKGKTIMGKSLGIQRILHHEDRGDGHAGAVAHAHPEEQIFIALEGKMKIREGDHWYTMEEGDLFFMPPNIEHEEMCEDDFLFLSFKNRIPGHCWYDNSWSAGAEKDWKTAEAILKEMEKYKEKTHLIQPYWYK